MKIEGGNVPSLKCQLVHQERMRPDGDFLSLLKVPISALTPTAGWHERHLTCTRCHHRFSFPSEGRSSSPLADPGSPGTWCAFVVWYSWLGARKSFWPINHTSQHYSCNSFTCYWNQHQQRQVVHALRAVRWNVKQTYKPLPWGEQFHVLQAPGAAGSSWSPVPPTNASPRTLSATFHHITTQC